MVAITRNKGYGPDGGGGPGGDASQGAVVNPNLARSESPQGSVPTVPEPLPIVNPTTTDPDEFPVEHFLFQGEVDEFIVCHAITVVNGVESEGQENINIAKPPQFRKSVVDADSELTYAPDATGNLQGTRERKFASNGGDVILLEKIDPPYTVEDRIFAARSQSTGVAGVILIDQNLQGRRWINIEPRYKYFQVTDVDKDTLDCQEWDFATNAQKIDSDGALLPSTLVAKIHDIRGSTWVGQTLAGVAYTSTDGTGEGDGHRTRQGVGSVTEQQEIIPEYLVNVIIIRASFVEIGTGTFRSGVQAIWEETGSRAFSEIF